MNSPPLLLMLTLATVALTAASILTAPTYAQDAPPPANKKRALANVDKSLEQHKQEKEEMNTSLHDLEKDLQDNRQKMASLGQEIRDNEQEAFTLEDKIKKATQEKDILSEKLEKDKTTIVQLIMAMDRLQKIPMAALAVKPGAPLETAQSALVIEDIGKALSARTTTLKSNAARFQSLITTLESDKTVLAEKNQKLTRDRAELANYLSKQERLYARTQNDIKEKQAIIARISAQSKTMKDLISNLQTRRAEEEKRAKEKSALTTSLRALPLLPSSNNKDTSLPVAGTIRVSYGQPDYLNAPSKGLWLESRASALVVAPMKGTVRFVGTFKSYGNIVIIEHDNAYHSLIAGLDKINVTLDRELTAGEPLGFMAQSGNDGKPPMLYFELRKSGKAIDPAVKFGKLAKAAIR